MKVRIFIYPHLPTRSKHSFRRCRPVYEAPSSELPSSLRTATTGAGAATGGGGGVAVSSRGLPVLPAPVMATAPSTTARAGRGRLLFSSSAGEVVFSNNAAGGVDAKPGGGGGATIACTGSSSTLATGAASTFTAGMPLK